MRLDKSLIGYWGDGLDTVRHLDRPRVPRHRWLSLQMHVHTLFLGLLLLGCVILHPGEEFVPRSRVIDMLDSDVDSLLDVSVADLLVDDDPDGGFGHVVDYTSLAVVDFERHPVVSD